MPEIFITDVASGESLQAFPKDISNMSVSSSEMKYDSLKRTRPHAKGIEPQQYVTNHSDVRSDVSSEHGTDEIRPLTSRKQTTQAKSKPESQARTKITGQEESESSLRSVPRHPKLTRKPPFKYVYSEW